MSKHSYELSYFGIPKGRAERVRLTFAAAGVQYTNTQTENFGELKAKPHALPFGHFPLLRVDGGEEKGGHSLSNSIALQVFVAAAEAPHLIPTSAIDQGRALAIANTTEDRFSQLVKFAFGSAETKDAARKDGVTQGAKFVDDLAHQLGHREFFGTTFSYADLTVWDWLDQAGAAFELDGAVDKHANLKAWRERVAHQKGVKEYLASRK